MFDLNELPENECPPGGMLRLATSKADRDVAAAVEEASKASENATKLIRRLSRDDEEESETKDGTIVPHSFFRLDSTSSMRYSNDWQTLGLTSFDESEIDTDNEVTVAALDAHAILDSQCVTGLDSAVSLVVSAEPASRFGISPRPEKLGQRNVLSHKRSEVRKFRGIPGRWEGFPSEKKGSERPEDGLKLDSRQSSLYPGIALARKGKRLREEGSHSSLVDTVMKLKRHVRPTPTLSSASEVYHGAGPSLSMSLEHDTPGKNVSFAPVYKTSSKGEGSGKEAATSLLLSEAVGTESESIGVQRVVTALPPLQVESNLELRLTATPMAKVPPRKGAEDLDAIDNSDEEDREVGRTDSGMRLQDRRPAPVDEGHALGGDASSEKPFWVGELCAGGFSASNVAAYCSEDLQPTSKLWGLPNVMTVEKLVRIEEFVEAIRKVNALEPLIRVRFLPDASANQGQSFSSMVRSLNVKKKGKAKDKCNGADVQLGWQNGSLACRYGPLASSGEEFVFVVSLKMKHPRESGRKCLAKLYLVLGTSSRAVCDIDRELGRNLLDELDRSLRVPDDVVLFGFLCAVDETSRLGVEAVMEVFADGGASASKGNNPVVVNSMGVSRVEKKDAEHVMTLEGEGGDVVLAEKEGPLTSGIHRAKSKEHDGHDGRRLERTRSRKENHSVRHSHIPTEDDAHRDRERYRDRDRDMRTRERDRDLRSTNKDVYRYSYRPIEKMDSFKRDRAKDKEPERFRERDYHRESHRDPPERSKSFRDRIKDQEKHRDKERRVDRDDRSGRKRDRSVEPEKGKTNDVKPALESDKAVVVKEESQDHFVQHPGKDHSKRAKVAREDSIAYNTAVDGNTVVLVPNEVGRGSKSDAATEKHTANENPVQNEEIRKGRDLVHCEVEAGPADAKVMDEKEADTEANDQEDRTTRSSEQVTTASEMKTTPEVSVTVFERAERKELAPGKCDPRLDKEMGAPVGEEVRPQSQDVAMEIDDTPEIVRSQQEIRGTEGMYYEAKVGDQIEKKLTSSKEVVTEFHDSGLDHTGNQGSEDNTGLTTLSVDPSGFRKIGAVVRGSLQHRKSRASLSVQVEHMLDAVEAHKSDDNGTIQDLEVSPERFLRGSDKLRFERSISFGGEDSQGNLVAVGQSPLYYGFSGSTLVEGQEISFQMLLEGCDKETRVWLESKPTASYLLEEFGVRIVKLEEVPSVKLDARVKLQQGPANVRIELATEKTVDANEGKWFLNHAADTLRAVASRGVFAKCLWYQGLVQRCAADPAPSIQAIVKRVKGEDGKNLERIQEKTGVMIGIVLDANSKKGLVNSARVIGLRLKCTRKKGFLEATKQVEELLLEVAEQFSKSSRSGVILSNDIALSKLKVDFSNNTSPSSCILTPMQKDVFAVYSPVSPVASLSPLGSFRSKLDEAPIESTHITCTASAAAAAPPIPAVPDSTLTVFGVNPPGNVADFGAKSQQSEDDEPDNVGILPDSEGVKCSRPLYVSNLPERASAPMLREFFEDVLKQKFGLPPGYDGVSELVLDVSFSPDKFSAFVEFASDELLLEVLTIYAEDKAAFSGLKLELGSSSSLNKLERLFLATRTEPASTKGLEYGDSIVDRVTFTRSRGGRRALKGDDQTTRLASARSSTESELDLLNQDRRYSGHDASFRFMRISEKPKPLFLTELMRNASARSIHGLFEDIIKKYVNPSVGNFKGRATVLDVRHIPSRGCAFVDLATSELVDFMLDLHSRRPEVFFHMKMEIGRRPVPLGQGEEEPVVKRSSHLVRTALVEETHSYGSGRTSRRFFQSTSPNLPRRSEMAVLDHEFADEFEEDDEEERQAITPRKRRSDPERTVYADRLPDNASEGMIRRIFERVLRDNMTEEQREELGENTITEVRYVPSKFCAFIVFVAEELTRLVLQLYNQDEDIFENMRLKPHFHSRMEDLYREDLHEREDVPHRVLSRDISMDRRSRRGLEDYQNTHDVAELGHRGRTSSAHRAVAATAFKEVDRRRSVYVDRIPERLPEPAMRELFERALRQNRHCYGSHAVSQVTFFRDKFDPDKLCAFVELDNEELVQELLDVYIEDEDSFSGMRVRPAIKFGN